MQPNASLEFFQLVHSLYKTIRNQFLLTRWEKLFLYIYVENTKKQRL